MADKNLSVPSKLISYHSDQSWNHQNASCTYVLHSKVPFVPLRSLFSMVKHDSKNTLLHKYVTIKFKKHIINEFR